RGVSKVVIDAPVYLSNAQKKEIESAGEIAGLDMLEIVDKPIAAALCLLNQGGNAFGVSILEIPNGFIEVKAKNGDLFLGGVDFDHVLVEYLFDEIRRLYSLDISRDGIVMMRLKEAAKKAKMELSSSLQALVHVHYIMVFGLDPIHANITVFRSKFKELVEC
ncbi:unnamed protein product, partial [Ilex paraguariensis]